MAHRSIYAVGFVVSAPMPATPVTSRSVALAALVEIEADGAYANLRLGPLLEKSGLDDRDRRLVTELVYGTIRRRRSLDYLVDRFLVNDPPPAARAALRLGAYQLRFTDIPDHAAVSATVDVAPKRFRGLINAVLRKVAKAPVNWPDDATRLSYPDWIVERFRADLGDEAAADALETMNRAPEVNVRGNDGYTQDRSSERVAAALGAEAGDLVVDVCAAPGGKATALAGAGAHVVAADLRPTGCVSWRATPVVPPQIAPTPALSGRSSPMPAMPAPFVPAFLPTSCSSTCRVSRSRGAPPSARRPLAHHGERCRRAVRDPVSD